MSKQRFQYLLDKSVAAAISAIEIYNKPDFKYREETFSILLVNAWEILLKAKILKDNNNNLHSIYIPEKTVSKNMNPLKRFYPKLNRCGNPKTIDIFKALELLNINKVLAENINLMIEIRDNSIHLINKDPFLAKKVLEIGTANLKSYVKMLNFWFNIDLSQYNFFLMPISFFHTFEMESHSINKLPKQISNLLQHIKDKETMYPSNEENDHNISLILITKFEKGTSCDNLKVGYSDKPDITIKIDSEEQFRKKYPLDHFTLIVKMKEKYSDFKQNQDFNKVKRELQEDTRFSCARYLDFINKKGQKKYWYSTEIFNELDKYYRRK